MSENLCLYEVSVLTLTYASHTLHVIAGLVPAIQGRELLCVLPLDPRAKPGDDTESGIQMSMTQH